ncbi:hypothetical protein PFICI_05763 [Pestalotiopsis fici W106-1]|uniref:Fe2OG dioxygenase domain-containing protein n=1 Tax=Pestalotiopsis fici (strain W106-1 / CGMCC3.15140) TaxID=1229662 RepID=W3XEQ9_PESFW|nr:uncharacterized protein PFICI_05763 [Pestalotiopsis fici W106-1]ETS83887.1 hypothetical protein PFICI_05763 [Pestalotiopsis fici W106-1]
MNNQSTHDGIRTIDISPFLNSDDNAVRKAVADDIIDALHVQGTCGIIGHGVGKPRLDEAFGWANKFFALPYEEKMKANHPDGIVPHRGFSGIGREKCFIYTEDELKSMSGELSATSQKPLDWKEHMDIGSDQEKVHHNLWIDEKALPGFQAYSLGLYWELERLSSSVLDALLLGLDVDEKGTAYYRDVHTGHQNGLRYIHYPEMREADIDRTSTTWCPTHTDFTTFTLLFQDGKQGLEIEDRLNPGTFIPATAEIKDRLWLTIGDFGEIWSNGYLPASRHRVVIPRPDDGREYTHPRYSMPYFINARHDSISGPQYTGKPGTMPKGGFKTGTVKEHIDFRMKFQY